MHSFQRATFNCCELFEADSVLIKCQASWKYRVFLHPECLTFRDSPAEAVGQAVCAQNGRRADEFRLPDECSCWTSGQYTVIGCDSRSE